MATDETKQRAAAAVFVEKLRGVYDVSHVLMFGSRARVTTSLTVTSTSPLC